MSGLNSPADICNAALARLGYRKRIGSLYDGSEISRPFLDIYGQTRDAMLATGDWKFAEGFAAGVLDGAAPFPWAYQYAYPADAIQVKDIFDPTAYAADRNNPVPRQFRDGNAVLAGVPTKVLWADIADATFVYIRRVTDPTQWDSEFSEAFIAGLARRIVAHVGDANMLKLYSEDEAAETKLADSVQG